MKRMDALRFILIALLAGGSSSALADSIQLRAKATVSASNITLADVAALEGDTATALADKIVATFDGSQSTMTLTQESLRASLRKAGVNWARVSLKGFDNCLISKDISASDTKPTKIVQPVVAPASPILSNPTEEVSTDTQKTLRDQLIDWMRKLHGSAGDSLRITFNDRDVALLSKITLEDKLIFISGASSNLGRVPVTVQRFRGEKLVDSNRISIEVAQRHLAVVAARTISKGDALSFEDLRISEVFLDRTEPDLLTKLDDAIGLIATASLREGSLVLKDQIRPTLLVQRNELIRIQAIVGGLVVQTFARALEDGGEGQLIQVRNERSRELFTVRVIALRTGLLADATILTDSKTAENTVNK